MADLRRLWPWRTAPAAASSRWVVVDVETTGLDPWADHLLAIAAVAIHWQDGRPLLAPQDHLECLVQPAHHCSTEANVLVHHIGVERQRQGWSPGQALDRWTGWLAGSPLLAFHAPFDRAILNRAMKRERLKPPPNPWVDLAEVGTLVDPAQHRDLDSWLRRYNIRPRQRHRALEDAWVTAELFLALWPALQRQGISGWHNIHQQAEAQATLRRATQTR